MKTSAATKCDSRKDVIEKFEKLAAASIHLLPTAGIPTHYVFARDGFVALVDRTGIGAGGIGAPGLLTERGIAMLVWKDGQAFFVTKETERAAAPEQVDSLRRFAADLTAALA